MIRRLLVVCNDLDFFLLHRLPETLGALRAGYQVHVAIPSGPRAAEIGTHGFVFHPLALSRSGANPFRELQSLLALYRLFREVKPDLVYLMTIKPILYGGVAARLAGVRSVVAAVFGLGFVFTDMSLKTRLLRVVVSLLYKLAFSHRRLRVIFQNPTDRELLVDLGAVSRDKTVMIQGSGVDLRTYCFRPEPEGTPVVLMAARLLRDKGVLEFVEAAQLLKRTGIAARFLLAGEPDAGNPSSFSDAELDIWRRKSDVEFLGFRKDMPGLMAAAHVIVLPSYREGLPRVLEEASACGRAVVTTDVPGCRDAIEPNVTGLLVPARSSTELAKAIRRLIEEPDLRKKMGEAGRLLAIRSYSGDSIVNAHLQIYQELIVN